MIKNSSFEFLFNLVEKLGLSWERQIAEDEKSKTIDVPHAVENVTEPRWNISTDHMHLQIYRHLKLNINNLSEFNEENKQTISVNK